MADTEPNKTISAHVGRALVARIGIVTLVLAVLLAGTMCGACVLGQYGPRPVRTLQILCRALPALVTVEPAALSWDEEIILHLRLPRVLLGAVVGALLAVAGTAFQGLLKNPLADPYIIGVSSGAAVGASIAIVLGLGAVAHGMGVPLLAFATGLATVAFVYSLAQQGGRVPVESFLLAGVVVGAFMWSAVFFFMTVAARERELMSVVFWLMGNLGGASWSTVVMIAPPAVVGPALIYLFARDLNIMLLGEESAVHLGVRVERLKQIIIALASLVTAVAVAAAGIIGFVGFIVPHIMRRLVGPDHRVLVPAAALGGAIFLICADTLARIVIAPSELPAGIITSLVGAPFFCHLLRKRRRAI